MDITLIPKAKTIRDEKLHQDFISEEGMVQLTDCSLILLHKSGMRPLYLMNDKVERILIQPEHEITAQPDLILFNDTDVGRQSARVVQEQLKRCGCFVKMLGTDFSNLDKEVDFNILKNMLLKRTQSLKKKGFHHAVIISEKEHLDKIARCMNEKGLNPSYNIPIYSFSDGKEIIDYNLIINLYITRDLLDNYLVGRIKRTDDSKLARFKGKCLQPLEIYQLRSKLHFPE